MHKPYKLLVLSHSLLFLGLGLWFSPLQISLHKLETQIFFFFNQTLTIPYWQEFWGLLNHRSEGSINLILAACLNIMIIMKTPRPLQRKLIGQTLYFWLLFQLGFMLQRDLSDAFINTPRFSPTLVCSPVLRLSTLLDNVRIKDASHNSFPGGHAFAMMYWGIFTYYIAPKRWGVLALFLGSFLCLPRLMSGAHWVSDVVFSILLAFVWFAWSLVIWYTSLFAAWHTKRQKL